MKRACWTVIVVLAWTLWLETELKFIGRSETTTWAKITSAPTLFECGLLQRVAVQDAQRFGDQFAKDKPELQRLVSRAKRVKAIPTATGYMAMIEGEHVTLFMRQSFACQDASFQPSS